MVFLKLFSGSFVKNSSKVPEQSISVYLKLKKCSGYCLQRTRHKMHKLKQNKSWNEDNSSDCDPIDCREKQHNTTENFNDQIVDANSNRLSMIINPSFFPFSSSSPDTLKIFSDSGESFFSVESEDRTPNKKTETDQIFQHCEYPSGVVYMGTIDQLKNQLNVILSGKDYREYISNGKWFVPRPNYIDKKLIEIGSLACNDLVSLVKDKSKKWKKWSDKQKILIEFLNEKNESSSFCGRATVRRKLAYENITMDFISEAIWQEENKALYDEFTETTLCFFEITRDINVTSQIFKSRFGISGRNFLLVLKRERLDDVKTERLIVGARSVPPELDLDKYLDRPDVAAEYFKKVEKTLRGYVYNAGFLIEKDKESNVWTFLYLNEADAVTKNIPKWIIDRVKIDQLKSINALPGLIEKLWLQKKGVYSLEPYNKPVP